MPPRIRLPLLSLREIKTSTTKKPPRTHFTSTGPYAHSKLTTPLFPQTPSYPSAAPGGQTINHAGSNTVDFQNPGASETPRQRVARLREAHRKTQLAQMSWQERMIDTWRIYMDYAHRGFVGFLIIFSVLCFAALIWSIFDITRYTRRNSRVYREETAIHRQQILQNALAARRDGTAILRQKMFLDRYEAVKDAEEARLSARNPWNKLVDSLFPGVQVARSEALVLAKFDEDLHSDTEKYEQTVKNLDKPVALLEREEQQQQQQQQQQKSLESSHHTTPAKRWYSQLWS